MGFTLKLRHAGLVWLQSLYLTLTHCDSFSLNEIGITVLPFFTGSFWGFFFFSEVYWAGKCHNDTPLSYTSLFKSATSHKSPMLMAGMLNGVPGSCFFNVGIQNCLSKIFKINKQGLMHWLLFTSLFCTIVYFISKHSCFWQELWLLAQHLTTQGVYNATMNFWESLPWIFFITWNT